ncbi:RIP metalloprotease RseP [Spiroplasma endosymbiont of Aspidapion aeneum]|uniref:RIP metalloprotease RseP n=1 Tax=Spiroplasma endosymbiont of Aspidapion aeneum TaxID=3066276 RepID=UPI00313BB74C
MAIFLGILIGIISLLILITLHELGHFVVAKLSGAYVYEFAIGFGPTLFTIKGKETWFKFKIFPFGGFNYIASKDVDPPKGRENEDVPDERKLESINRWKKTIFIICGPLVNLVIALFLFSTVIGVNKYYSNDMYFYGANYSSISKSSADEIVNKGDVKLKYEQDLTLIGMRIWSFNSDENKYYLNISSLDNDKDKATTNSDPEIDYTNVKNYSYADNYKKENVFLKKDSKNAPTYYTTVYSFIDQVASTKSLDNKGGKLKFDVQLLFRQRDSYSEKFINNKIFYSMIGNHPYKPGDNIGISPPTHYFLSSSQAFVFGLKETFIQIFSTIKAFGNLFVGNFKSLSGPIGIINVASKSISNSSQFFLFVGSISASLFMFNMLFIPPLDGYRMIENFIEMVLKREINTKTKYWIYGIGICIMLGLIILSTVVDITR